MKIDELEGTITNLMNELGDVIGEDIPDIIGVEAVNHFKEGFTNEGFTDEGLVKWQEVKRRQGGGTGADANRKILTGRSRHLQDSITYRKGEGLVIISANPQNTGAEKNYAAVHNWGAINAGRNRDTVIPQRKFLAHSQALNKAIYEKIIRTLQQVLK